MITLGLTGSIGMGKSFVASIFADMGASVFDADAVVHLLLSGDKNAITQIRENFPEAIIENQVNRKKLGDIVFTDKEKLKQLEDILHPLVWQKKEEFLEDCRKNKTEIAVLDIPLLFETGSYKKCDHVAVVAAPDEVQQERVAQRGNIGDKKFKQINSLQISTEEKIKRADFVIKTGLDKSFVIEQVEQIISQVTKNA
jgi:dephospho-CoA kinase